MDFFSKNYKCLALFQVYEDMFSLNSFSLNFSLFCRTCHQKAMPELADVPAVGKSDKGSDILHKSFLFVFI